MRFSALRPFLVMLCGLCVSFLGAGCADINGAGGGVPGATQTARINALRDRIASEPAGDYYVGRRYYNPNYKFWGYVRRPGQPWKSAQLVMFNENQKLAPDREINQLGVDDNCEYKLFGRFTGETVYEPASNSFYPEFALSSYQLTDRNPPSIFPNNVRPAPTSITRPD